jgi:pyruvate kinase
MCRLNLLWGVRTVKFERTKATDETIEEVKNILVDLEHLQKGDVFVNVATIPMTSGNGQRANMVKISVVE